MASRVGCSEASRFFLDDQDDLDAVDEALEASRSTSDRVIELLNKAQLAQKDDKLNYLKQVQELIVNKEPNLLDNFLDEILVFQHDQNVDIRKFVLGFIEDACKKDVEVLSKVIDTLVFLLNDSNVVVVKKVMLCCTQLYRLTLQFISKLKIVQSDMKSMWQIMCQLKHQIISKIESDNDGIRTHSIKFMEMVILSQSNKPQELKDDESVSLDVVPRNHPLISMTELRAEAGTTLETLLSLVASPIISSVNLMASLGTLAAISKQRPAFMSLVVEAFESLHANLPTSLSKSQVSSVRKNLKLHLMNLLKNPAAVQYYPQITTLLTDLGATQNEMQKNMVKVNLDAVKRARPETSVDIEPESKKQKSGNSAVIEPIPLLQAIEVTKEDLIPRLNKERVAELVLISMLALPEIMPTSFQETYTPIAAAGGVAQVSHLARLMASQMTNAGIGVGAEKMTQQKLQMDKLRKRDSNEPMTIPVIGGNNVMEDDPTILAAKKEEPLNDSAFQRLVAGQLDVKEKQDIKKPLVGKQPAVTQRVRKIKAFKLAEIKKILNPEERANMVLNAFQRILAAEKSCIQGGKATERLHIVVSLVTQFGGALRTALKNFILVDPRARYDLACQWIFEEFAKEEALIEQEEKDAENLIEKEPEIKNSYNESIRMILNGFKERLDPKDKLITRIFLDAPRLTEDAKSFLRECCEDTDRLQVGFSTLRDLILLRPANQIEYLNLLLELTSHKREQVRVQAIHAAKKLHPRTVLATDIEHYALQSLKLLLNERPPNSPSLEWTDDSIKLCLYLYLALLPLNHKLLHELASLYTEASPLVKRTILRHLEHPVRSIGMASDELLKLVETCPNGAETLITRILHIITEKSSPSTELVHRVKELYHKRVSDVRILIPVLTGLEKKEVIEVLPKLIKQSPNVVKEVFNRLLGCFHGESTISSASPLTPSELLVTLHNIEDKTDMKSTIKAIGLCFAEKTIYTQEVLAVVLQQLMDKNPLPTLFMRTVIQSLGACPRLVGFAMNILSKLISKQVWKQPKVWQGFVKCCQMTKPQSYPILLQLPSRQLESVFELCPELKDLLRTHIEQFTPHQRALIPRSLIQILEKDAKSDASKTKSTKKEKEEDENTEEKATTRNETEETKLENKTEDIKSEDIKSEDKGTSPASTSPHAQKRQRDDTTTTKSEKEPKKLRQDEPESKPENTAENMNVEEKTEEKRVKRKNTKK